MRARAAVVLTLVAATEAFMAPYNTVLAAQKSSTTAAFALLNKNDPDSSVASQFNAVKATVTTAFIWAAAPLASLANESPDWGLFEGRIGSLLHPITMLSLLVFSSYTGFLGFQWRRQRTIGDEISALKKTLPDLGGASSVAAALQAEPDAPASRMAELSNAKAVEAEIAALQDERKSLAAAGPRDQHYSQGALLVLIGTVFAIEGSLNTYGRAGKLFPGPHLFVGAGLVCLWALAAACVPAMQKGNETARTVHISANLIGVSFFAWQLVTGLPILFKVVELTKWP